MSANGSAVDPDPGAVVPAVVAIETATETVGVAVRTPAGVEAAFALTGRRRHVESLTPALEHLLTQVDLVPGDLGVVAVDVGPGLFTGLRVGVAAAKALAQSLGVGVLTATSLDILTAAAAEVGHSGLILACVDARRGEVFASVRELDPHGPGPRRTHRPWPLHAGRPGGRAPRSRWCRRPRPRRWGTALRRGARRRPRRRGRAGPGVPAARRAAPARNWGPSCGKIARRARVGRSPVHAGGGRTEQLCAG